MKRLSFLLTLVTAAIICSPCFSHDIRFQHSGTQGVPAQEAHHPILADSQKIELLTEQLRPLLLSTFGEFDLELWYARKSGWKAQYGDPASILHIADIIYKDYLADDRLSEAAAVKNAISRLHTSDGEYSQAINEGQIAYELTQRAKDTIGIGWNLTCISNNLFRAYDLEAAQEYANRALKISRDHNAHDIESSTLIIIAGIKAQELKYDSSLAAIKEALAIAKEHRLSTLEKKATLNMTYVYNRQEKYDQTISLLTQGTSPSKMSNSLYDVFLCFNLYGAYLGKGDFDKATSYLDLGCTKANEIELMYAILACHEYRTDLFEKQGLYQQALEASKKTRETQVKLAGIEQTKAIQSLKNQLNLLEKDLEIKKLDQARKDTQQKNSRWFRSLIFSILFLVFFVPYLYFYMRKRNQVKIAEQQQKIAEAKIQVLQSQMHPHFIFNTLNGIQNFILKSKKIEAYNYLGKFATLFRTLTKTSSKANINLDQEIEFITAYMALEKLRFRDAFIYSINVSPELMDVTNLVPKMVIQPVLENALIHGISGLNRQGVIEVRIESTNEQKGIRCVVTDNGRGRAAAAKQAQKNGKSGNLSIATTNAGKRFDFLRHLGYEDVSSTIEDLYENGVPAGTKVTLFLPFMREEVG